MDKPPMQLQLGLVNFVCFDAKKGKPSLRKQDSRSLAGIATVRSENAV